MTATPRPRVTLAWAQGIDGSIAAAPGLRTRLSGPESLRMTHTLRARHEAILVGVGTVLADDPSLTVRLVPGPSPRPVILDSRLRTPPGARLLDGAQRGVLILSLPGADPGRRAALADRGARILEVPPDAAGRLDLHAALARLHAEGIRSLMVEGGALVLRSFLAARLADELCVTIAPRILDGLNPFATEAGSPAHAFACGLEESRVERLGADVVISGRPRWDGGAASAP